MLRIKEAIVVEGRYDKTALASLVDTEILTTEGFGIFRDREKIRLLQKTAEKRGLIILTDSDGAGLVIRNRLRGCIDEKYIKHAYIPPVPGKERRKSRPSREGIIGVEGMSPAVLEEALRRAGAEIREHEGSRLTKTDLYSMGLSGTADASVRRRQLQKALDLPENLSANAFLDALNCLYSPEEVSAALNTLQEKSGEVPEQKNPDSV